MIVWYFLGEVVVNMLMKKSVSNLIVVFNDSYRNKNNVKKVEYHGKDDLYREFCRNVIIL